MRVRKAIFPVAGFGTRFLPATKSQPKEMLPIVDKPVIHYLVEEAVAAGIEEIILITGRGKKAIEDYFDVSFELEHTLVEKGKHKLLKEVTEISNLARFVYVRQPIPKGDGHAILCAKDLIGNEPFAVMFGDDIIDSKTPALSQIIDFYHQVNAPVVGLTTVPQAEVSNYGIISSTDTGPEVKINNIIEKPSIKDAPSNRAIIGKYVLTPEILEILSMIQTGTKNDGEIRLVDGLIQTLQNKKAIFGKEIIGKRYDAGSKIGFLKATIDFALKREDLGPELKAHLRSIDF